MPILLPCTAGSCSTIENGVSDLPTNIIRDTGLGGIYPGHPALSDKTNCAVHNSTQSQHRQSSWSISCFSDTVYCHYSLPGYLNQRDEHKAFNIFISTSLALHRDKRVLKMLRSPRINSYV